MLTTVFNCPTCNKPFDLTRVGPAKPVYALRQKAIWCRTCAPGSYNPQQLGLMDFLNQPAFQKTNNGFEYTLPINDPKCSGCEENIKLAEGAFTIQCGHYLCKNCMHKRIDGAYSGFCSKCGVYDATPCLYPKDAKLTAFAAEIAGSDWLDEVKARLEAIKVKKEADRADGALKDCGDCGSEQPVERLFKCNDCDKINCGNCFFDSHQGHAVVKLLGVELDEMERQNDIVYTAILEGLHGNIHHVQKNIDNAVEKVVKAGKDRLTKIKQCKTRLQGKQIVKRVEKAALDFEKHFEVYIPVARELATRLEEMGEELRKEEE